MVLLFLFDTEKIKINLIKRIAFDICVFGTFFYMLCITQVHRRDLVLKLQSAIGMKEVIEKSPYVKYVLIVTPTTAESINYMGEGNETFCERNCSFKNCFLTSDGNIFKYNNTSAFDAVLFHVHEELDYTPEYYLPREHYDNQSFIFASRESSQSYTAIDRKYNGIFNFTWTYKLDSDIKFAYMSIKDGEGQVIGPNATIPWINIDDMLPINDTIKIILADKHIAAAWFVTNCDSLSGREKIIEMVVEELNRFNMTVDIYGDCESYYKSMCTPESMGECLEMLQRDYYFYLAFENALGKDFVTDQLLIALQNYAVPVVYGGADYTRFMPAGIYLDVNNMSVIDIVKEMTESIKNKTRYYDFFKWHNHYSYHHPEDQPDTDPFCSFCKFLNNIDYNKASVVDNLDKWWINSDEVTILVA